MTTVGHRHHRQRRHRGRLVRHGLRPGRPDQGRPGRPGARRDRGRATTPPTRPWVATSRTSTPPAWPTPSASTTCSWTRTVEATDDRCRRDLDGRGSRRLRRRRRDASSRPASPSPRARPQEITVTADVARARPDRRLPVRHRGADARATARRPTWRTCPSPCCRPTASLPSAEIDIDTRRDAGSQDVRRPRGRRDHASSTDRPTAWSPRRARRSPSRRTPPTTTPSTVTAPTSPR